jgi:hypothetical protein
MYCMLVGLLLNVLFVLLSRVLVVEGLKNGNQISGLKSGQGAVQYFFKLAKNSKCAPYFKYKNSLISRKQVKSFLACLF